VGITTHGWDKTAISGTGSPLRTANKRENPAIDGINKNIGMSQIFLNLKSKSLLSSFFIPFRLSFMNVRRKAATVGPNGATYKRTPPELPVSKVAMTR